MARLLPFIMLLLLAVVGCTPAFIAERNVEKYDYVIARADTRYELTMPEFYDMLLHSELMPYGGMMSAEVARAVLDSILVDTLAGLRADEIDLCQHYEYCRTYKLRYRNYLMKRFLDETVYRFIDVDSQDIADFYDSRPDLFNVSEQVLLYQILISPVGQLRGPDSVFYRLLTPEELEQEVREHAYRVRRLLDFGEPFKNVARKYSDDSQSAFRGGYVGWTTRGAYLDPFDSVAFSMEPGEISQPYRDNTGWHILYIEDHVDDGIPPMDERTYIIARNTLIQHEANKLGKPLRDSLMAQVELEFHEDVLDTNIYFVEKSEWAAIVNGQDTIDFYDLRGLEETYRSRYRVANTTVQMKKEMMRDLAASYAYLKTCRDLGIDTLPDVVAEEYSLRHKYCKAIVLAEHEDPLWTPGDGLVEEYYRDNIEDFKGKRPLRIQHIIVEDSLLGEFVRDQAVAGVDFLELAAQYYPGEPSIRAELANLGEIREGEVPQALYRAALMTPVGGISYPVKTEYGYHIVKVISRAKNVSISEAQSQIVPVLRRRHEQELFRQFRDELYEHFNVTFPGLLVPIHLKPLAQRSE